MFKSILVLASLSLLILTQNVTVHEMNSARCLSAVSASSLCCIGPAEELRRSEGGSLWYSKKRIWDVNASKTFPHIVQSALLCCVKLYLLFWAACLLQWLLAKRWPWSCWELNWTCETEGRIQTIMLRSSTENVRVCNHLSHPCISVLCRMRLPVLVLVRV